MSTERLNNYLSRRELDQIAFRSWEPHQRFLQQLEQLGRNHSDPSRKNFYLAIHKIIVTELNLKQSVDFDDGTSSRDLVTLIHFMLPFLQSISEEKSAIQHFLNLLCHTHLAEFPFLIDNLVLTQDKSVVTETNTGWDNTEKIDYSTFTVDNWITAILWHLSDATIRGLAAYELSHRSTQTFVLERYAAAQIILRWLFGDQEVDVADTGCSIGMGLPGLKKGAINFSHIKFEAEPLFFPSDTKAVNIRRGYAFDLENILDPPVIDWILACMFYPSEKATKYDSTIENYQRLRPDMHHDFLSIYTGDRGNICCIDQELSPNSLDAIIVTTTLYQMNEIDRNCFFSAAESVLKEGGVLIISDFAHITEGMLDFSDTWFNDVPKYRTFVRRKTEGELAAPLEVFKFTNARCTTMFKGQDYDSFRKVII